MPSRETLRYFIFGALAALAAAVTLWSVWPVDPGSDRSSHAAPTASPKTSSGPFPAAAGTPAKPWAKADPGRAAMEPLAPAQVNTAAPRSPLADSLNRPDKTGSEDIQVVYSLLTYYRKTFGAFPTGEDNRQIVNALAGNNPKGLAILPRDHPAINASGELVDRWQTPFFFHLISRENVEVRSAGADREMWTADDLLAGQKP